MQKKWDIDASIISRCKSDESWSGSYYEVSMGYSREIFYKREPSYYMKLLWENPALCGVVRDPDQFGVSWQQIDALDTPQGQHFYGYMRFPTGQIIGCGSQYTASKEMIWLTLYIPLSLLDLLFPIHYPVTHKESPWITQINKFLATIATQIYHEAPFLLAIMGEEATAFPLNTILTAIAHNPGLLVPETTFRELDIKPYGTRLADGLWWTSEEI
jgi:hypothetical protein